MTHSVDFARVQQRPPVSEGEPTPISRHPDAIPIPLETIAHDPWLATITHAPQVSLFRLFYATVLKRTIDIVASTILLLLLAPLLVIAMLAIRLDSPGSAIFTQDRVGRHGRIFRLYKFRTMSQAASGKVTWLVDEDGTKRHKLRNDPRVTRVGKWLRYTSLDELPQLLNIIRGDMSLIGPRPELVEIVRNYEDWQHQRHIVRPGLTGWWQVSGRSDKPMHENTELDLFYVRGQSFRLDLLIALKTIRVVVKGLGAF
jgi:lipopolysaccharide/colanic/teichoic acid biosynthesis glycosyltransferase